MPTHSGIMGRARAIRVKGELSALELYAANELFLSVKDPSPSEVHTRYARDFTPTVTTASPTSERESRGAEYRLAVPFALLSAHCTPGASLSLQLLSGGETQLEHRILMNTEVKQPLIPPTRAAHVTSLSSNMSEVKGQWTKGTGFQYGGRRRDNMAAGPAPVLRSHIPLPQNSYFPATSALNAIYFNPSIPGSAERNLARARLRASSGPYVTMRRVILCTRLESSSDKTGMTMSLPLKTKLVRIGAAPECKSGGNGISPRKLANQWHRPARIPLAKIEELTGRGLNPVRLVEPQMYVHWLLPHTRKYGIRFLFSCKSAIGSESSRAYIINSDPIRKAVHDKASTSEINLRKMSLPLPAHFLSGTPSDMCPIKVGPLRIQQHRHGSYVIRVQAVNTSHKVIRPINIGVKCEVSQRGGDTHRAATCWLRSSRLAQEGITSVRCVRSSYPSAAPAGANICPVNRTRGNSSDQTDIDDVRGRHPPPPPSQPFNTLQSISLPSSSTSRTLPSTRSRGTVSKERRRMKWCGKLEIPEKTRRPVASYSTIPTCKKKQDRGFLPVHESNNRLRRRGCNIGAADVGLVSEVVSHGDVVRMKVAATEDGGRASFRPCEGCHASRPTGVALAKVLPTHEQRRRAGQPRVNTMVARR
ncbi:hypothetical protein PR048_024599 [Dryococelus australis]|uniref:Uncharacterized protein n=1 Tax=Dryococelus australis TaxID=614101 RepID=A0ABQ9GP07_9NEOP|nr:hypothetical protein PR048_024599 [Dryococelus australis]